MHGFIPWTRLFHLETLAPWLSSSRCHVDDHYAISYNLVCCQGHTCLEILEVWAFGRTSLGWEDVIVDFSFNCPNAAVFERLMFCRYSGFRDRKYSDSNNNYGDFVGEEMRVAWRIRLIVWIALIYIDIQIISNFVEFFLICGLKLKSNIHTYLKLGKCNGRFSANDFLL